MDLGKLSPGIFALVLVCFFLPFVSISCMGQEVALSGVQLVTGSSVGGEPVEAEPLAVVAFLCTLAALGLAVRDLRSSSGSPQGSAGSAVFAALGAVSLLLLKVRIDREALLLDINYEAGFWLALVLLLIGAGVNGYLLLQGSGSPRASSSISS